MNKLLPPLICLLSLFPLFSHAEIQDEQRFLYGFVGDNVMHGVLLGVKVETMTADSTVIFSMVTQSNVNVGGIQSGWYGRIKEPGTYIVRFSLEGYQTKEITVTIDKFRKREHGFKQPPVYLARKPKERALGEAVVKATKVKFYSKGDTLVYNADAFQMQEGSMLDALIRQLPGVELKDDGRILVNGRYVESLLLNGEDFFRGDRSIMLDNLPTYAVQTVQVYDKTGRLSEMIGRNAGDEQLVMDVRLKKQYSIGWIANAEAAGGTEERYLARLFALRFTNHSRLSFFGAVNNVNEYVKPGEGSEWTPSVGNGLTTTRHAGADYLINDRNKRFKLQGNAEVRHSDDAYDQRSTSVNFLSGGDTYGRSSYRNRTHNVALGSYHTWDFNWEKFKLTVQPSLTYLKTRQTEGQLSGTFATDPGEYMGNEVLDSLFRPGLDSRVLAATLNRYRADQRYSGHSVTTGLYANSMMDIPHSGDHLQIEASGNYGDNAYRRFTHPPLRLPCGRHGRDRLSQRIRPHEQPLLLLLGQGQLLAPAAAEHQPHPLLCLQLQLCAQQQWTDAPRLARQRMGRRHGTRPRRPALRGRLGTADPRRAQQPLHHRAQRRAYRGHTTDKVQPERKHVGMHGRPAAYLRAQPAGLRATRRGGHGPDAPRRLLPPHVQP